MRNRLAVSAVAAILTAGVALSAQQAPPAQPEAAASATPVAPQPKVKSQGEGQALQAIFQAQDPDTRVKSAEEFLQKYADSEFKPYILMVVAETYFQKNDFEKMVIYGERTIEADPKNFMAMLMLARGIAQRTREFDLDREEKLKKVENYVQQANEALKDAPRPRADITDAQWAEAKKDFAAQGHEALGLAALARKKYDVAATEFKAAIDSASNPDPATSVRLAHAYTQSGKYDEAIAITDKIMAVPDMHPTIKQFAQAERARAMQMKNSGAKPAQQGGSTAPGQIEIKR